MRVNAIVRETNNQPIYTPSDNGKGSVSVKELQASILIDTGNDALNFVSQAWLTEKGHMLQVKKGPPRLVNYAGTDNIDSTSDVVSIVVNLVAPVTGKTVSAEIQCYVLPIKDDIILSFPTIVKHFTSLTIELLLQYGKPGNNTMEQMCVVQAMLDNTAAADTHACLAAIEDSHVRQELEEEYKSLPNQAADDSNPKPSEHFRSPLGKEDPAPEDAIIKQRTLFGEEIEEHVARGNSPEAYQERLQEYHDSWRLSISDELHRDCAKEILELMESDSAINAFTYREWTGIKIEPIRLQFQDIPKYMKCPARPIPSEIKEEAYASIQRFVDMGYLRLQTQGAYGAGLVCVWKPDRTARICGDYRQINKYIANIPLIMPDIVESLEKMRKFKYFAEFDWRTAFHQLPLDRESAERLAVTTPWGVYSPMYVPEGIASGSALLMQQAQRIFADFNEWCSPVHDNILIGADTAQEIIVKSKRLLERCNEHNIQLKVTKSKLGVKRIKFFGYILEHGKYSMEEERIQGLRDIAFPSTQTEVQSFCGIMTFISPFIHNYAAQMSHIFRMSQKDFSFKEDSWGDIDYRVEWNKAKDLACQATALYLPDRSLRWQLRSDASKAGVGAVLTQNMPIDRLSKEERTAAEAQDLIEKGGDGELTCEVPIAFTSKSFTAQASKWTTTEQELFAIVHAYKKLERLLRYKPITVHTDHANLVALQYGQFGTTAKATRWRMWLGSFPMHMKHIPGKDNKTADFLSRHLKKMAQESEDNHALAAFSTIKQVLDEVHQCPGGHRGALATWRKVQHKYRGSKIPFRLVKDYVDECAVCQKLRTHPDVLESINKALPLYHARAVIHADVLKLNEDQYGNKYAFVFINNVTKYCMIYPAPDKEAANAADALIKLMSTIGLVDVLWTDQGGEFTADTTKLMLKRLGTGLTFTLAHRPQANGTVERLNGEILKEVTLLLENPETWGKWSHPTVISLVQLLLNHRTHGSTGCTPIELTFGRNASSYFPTVDKLQQGTAQTHNEYMKAFDEHLQQIHSAAIEIQRQKQRQRTEKQPQHIVRFNKGDLVLYKRGANDSSRQFKQHKLMPPRLGPYRVVRQEKSTDGTYSNTVTCTPLTEDTVISLHHQTLTLFAGTEEQAQELAKIDDYEFAIRCIKNHKGNVSTRTQMQFLVEYEDGEEKWMDYMVVQPTQAFEAYVQQYTWGRRLMLSTEALKTKRNATNPASGETLRQAIAKLPADQQPKENKMFLLSLYAWNTATWQIDKYDKAFGLDVKDKEPFVEATITKIQGKRIEVCIHTMKVKYRNQTVQLKRDIDLDTFLSYTIPASEQLGKQILISEANLIASHFQREFYAANNLPWKTLSRAEQKSRASEPNPALSNLHLLTRCK